MFNVQQITSRLSMMSDAQLAQYARLHKDDPYILPMAAAEAKRRQQTRQGVAGQQAMQQATQPTIADQNIASMQLPEDQGIGVLPAQNIEGMADGGIAGYAEGKKVFDPDKYIGNPNVEKFLAYINTYEGSPQANHLVGFRKFESLEDHPRTPVKFNKKGDKSTAAGSYQLLSRTWDEQKRKLGLTDFSPENQKRAAIGLLKDRGVLQAVVNGDFDTAKKKAAKVWASIPGSTIGEATGQKARFKPQAEAILKTPTPSPTRMVERDQAPVKLLPSTQMAEAKEPSLSRRIFDMLPFSSAVASDVVPRADDFKARVAAARAAHKERFGKDLPITSEARTRAEQQKLYDDWKAGKPGIYRPVNPADYPGRKTFHEDAVDISKSVPESFLKEFGLHRPIKGDPVHAVAMRDWQPPALAKAEPKAEPKVVAQRPPEPKRDTSGLPSIISSAQAGELPKPKTKQVAVEGMAGPASTGITGLPLSDESKRLMGAAPTPAPKAATAAPVADDTMYTSEGIPLIAPPGGPDTKAPTTALLTGTADLLLGIPEAITDVITQDYYVATGKSATEARAAAQNNPAVQAAGMLRSGKWFGVENDPAYRKDPLSVIVSLPALGVEGIAKKFNIDNDAALLALNNALVFAPVIGKVKQVQYNLPKLPGKEPPTLTPDLAQNAVKQALDEVRAAETKTEAPRLPAPTTETPGAVRVTPEGVGVLPTGEAAASKKAGLAGLAEDQLALSAARRKLAEAEAVAAASSKVPGKTLAERFGALPFTSRAAVPYGALAATTDVSGRGAETPEVQYPDISENMYPTEQPKPEAAPTITPEKIEAAKELGQQVLPKTGGLSNEDYVTMGLNMMMAQPGQPGGALSQLASNVGRSGIATLQARREREKLEQERSYKDIYSQYLKAQTAQFGREPEEVRTIRALDKDPGLFDRYLQIRGASVKAALVRSWTDRSKDPLLGPEFLKQYPTVESYLASSGYGNVDTNPRVAEALKLYP
jgi:muramidase (phage lysozyme)